jgi:hypothetical protein
MTATTELRDFVFTEAELDRVEDDLILALENYSWRSEDIYLRPSSLRASLVKCGHTRARIKATIDRLIERGVFEVRPHVLAGVIDIELNKYFTTRGRWFAYVAERRRKSESETRLVNSERDQPNLSRLGNAVAERKEETRGKRGRGRPRDTDVKADQRVYDMWSSGRYRTYEELGRQLNQPGKRVACTIDRHRKRKRRERN